MKKDESIFEEGIETDKGKFTAEDLCLGKIVSRHAGIIVWGGLALCVGIAIFAFLNVSWDTRMPYDGKYNRRGTGIPMQIAMLPIPLTLIGLVRDGRKPDSHHMRQGSRVATYIMVGGWVALCIWGQSVMAQSILEAGGAFH
jgi:hypothetical protein